MIERIRGRIEERGLDFVIVDLGPVSLRVNTTATTLQTLGERKTDVALFTYLYQREDVMVLYGFGSRDERELFERLIGIGGVGPRAAQAMLSTFAPDALRDTIENERVDVLIRVPGIGRKTAQRVILELKGKLVPLGVPAVPAAAHASGDDDLIAVLVGLGYSTAEAAEALRHVPAQEGVSDEDRLRAALRHFATP